MGAAMAEGCVRTALISPGLPDGYPDTLELLLNRC